MLVSKPTHGGGAPLGIDLEAGIATIKIARPAPAAAAEDSAADAKQVAAEPVAAQPAQPAEPADEPPDQT